MVKASKNVVVTDPKTGKTVLVAAGQELPKGSEDQAGDAAEKKS